MRRRVATAALTLVLLVGVSGVGWAAVLTLSSQKVQATALNATPPGPSHVLRLADLTASAVPGNGKNPSVYRGTIGVTVTDTGNGAPIPNVTVAGGWSPEVANPSGCTTGANGQCTFTTANGQPNALSTGVQDTWTVSGLTATGYTYGGAAANAYNSGTVLCVDGNAANCTSSRS